MLCNHRLINQTASNAISSIIVRTCIFWIWHTRNLIMQQVLQRDWNPFPPTHPKGVESECSPLRSEPHMMHSEWPSIWEKDNHPVLLCLYARRYTVADQGCEIHFASWPRYCKDHIEVTSGIELSVSQQGTVLQTCISLHEQEDPGQKK